MQTVGRTLLTSLLVPGLTACAIESAHSSLGHASISAWDAGWHYPDATLDSGDVDPSSEESSEGSHVRLRAAPEVVDACNEDALSEDQSLVPDDLDPGEAGPLRALASCLQSGALSGYELELVGSTDLPGTLVYPAMGGGDADRVRSALNALDVPFSQIRTTRITDATGIAAVGVRKGSVYVRLAGREC